MKKIIITIGTLMAMSFVSHNTSNNYELEEVKNDIYDYIEWMEQDIESGVISPNIGELYIENFETTLKRLNNVERDLLHLSQNK